MEISTRHAEIEVDDELDSDQEIELIVRVRPDIEARIWLREGQARKVAEHILKVIGD